MVNLDFLTTLKSVTVNQGKFAVSVGDAVFLSSGAQDKITWKRFSIEQLFNSSYDNTDAPNLVFIGGVAFCNGAFVAGFSKGAEELDFSTPFTGRVTYYLFSPDGTQQWNLDTPDSCFEPIIFELDGPLLSYSSICTSSISIAGVTTWQVADGPPSQNPPVTNPQLPACPAPGGGQNTLPPQPYTEDVHYVGTGATSTTTDGIKWAVKLASKEVADSIGVNAGNASNSAIVVATKDTFYFFVTDGSPYSGASPGLCGYPSQPFPINGTAVFSGAPIDTVYTSKDGASWNSKDYVWTGGAAPFPPAHEPPAGLTLVSPGNNQKSKAKNGSFISNMSPITVTFANGGITTPNLSPMVNFYAKDVLNNTFCVLGTDTDDANAYVATSPNGKTWTVTNLEPSPSQGGFLTGNFAVAAGNLGHHTSTKSST